MIKQLFFIFFIAHPLLIFAQTIKTDVLVVGGSPSGVAAAVQCARSKVKTILAADRIQLSGNSSENAMVNTGYDIPSGVWGEFRRHVTGFYKNMPGYDTSAVTGLRFDKAIGENILKKMTDTIKNLSVYLNSSFIAIKKTGDRWDVKINLNGKETMVKARVVIDATGNGNIGAAAGGAMPERFDPYGDLRGADIYRTSIAAGSNWPGEAEHTGTRPGKYPPAPVWCIPADAVLVKGSENLLVTEKIIPGRKDASWLPVQLELGQGAGTIAAYCAFFKTSTAHLKIRLIQGELLDFKGNILPFADIGANDPDWRAIQQIGATGLLKGRISGNASQRGFEFMPDSGVYTHEIKPGLTEIYTRAFLWFDKAKPGRVFTLGNLLSFISDYSLTDPDVVVADVRKDWTSRYHFEKPFGLQRPVTRREFAVLANRYFNPFARTVDLSGTTVN